MGKPKHIALLVLCVFFALPTFAQLADYELLPSENPHDKDTIRVNLIVVMPWAGAAKQSSSLVQSNDSIFYTACYYMGANGQGEEYLPDTIVIPPLHSGTYNLRVTINRTPFPGDDYCDSLQQVQTRVYDTIITVSKYTGITQAGGAQLQAVLLNSELMQLHAPYAGTANIQVLDVAGKQCYIAQRQVVEGKNEVHLNMAALPSGLYLYHIQLGEQRRVLKYVKQ